MGLIHVRDRKGPPDLCILQLVYALFLLSIFFGPILLAGLAVMGLASPSGLALGLCGFAIIDVLAWFIIRSVRGFLLASKGQPFPDLTSWAFGG